MLAECTYVNHIQGMYQPEMLTGKWSASGLPLQVSTVNLRVQQACDFLSWMSDRGHRPQFDVPTKLMTLKKGSASSAKGSQSFEVQVRHGKLRKQLKSLHMPSKAEVERWLEQVETSCGVVFRLMCEFILLTGVRREELASLRHDFIPHDPLNWRVVNPLASPAQQQIRISLKYGVKGRFYGYDLGSKIGPERSILLPLSLAKKIHHYRLGNRAQQLKERLRQADDHASRLSIAKNSVHLFLREDNNQNFTGKRIYDLWTKPEIAIDKWTPHQGRHWWACTTLMKEVERNNSINYEKKDLLELTAISIIRLQIQPQLGHSDDQTTMVYLRWLVDNLATPIEVD